jgi:hypothetical protein
MDDTRPSLARRALAAAVLVVVAIVVVRLIVGVLSAIFWLLAIAVLVVAGLWAWTTLRSGRRDRHEKRTRRTEPSRAPAVTSADDRVDEQLRRIKQQLRDQGRL